MPPDGYLTQINAALCALSVTMAIRRAPLAMRFSLLLRTGNGDAK